ncbi:MAG: hypothetical protein HYT38_00275 [Candidatus Sungbacteria bacterium]|uniref:Uncharacterized protein n=1 Tax=Candidatus Sungiibacteriota bacterium TaxID=2750080 RepID=A0A9D6HQD3_9BACT|nr:hypothetical protein [Candidatus Sungbacteria bacterium]
MATRTASKNKDFVTIPRETYEEFLVWQKVKNVKEVKPTKEDLRIIKRGEKNIRAGNYVSWGQLKNELAYSRNRSRKKSN